MKFEDVADLVISEDPKDRAMAISLATIHLNSIEVLMVLELWPFEYWDDIDKTTKKIYFNGRQNLNLEQFGKILLYRSKFKSKKEVNENE